MGDEVLHHVDVHADVLARGPRPDGPANDLIELPRLPDGGPPLIRGDLVQLLAEERADTVVRAGLPHLLDGLLLLEVGELVNLGLRGELAGVLGDEELVEGLDVRFVERLAANHL